MMLPILSLALETIIKIYKDDYIVTEDGEKILYDEDTQE